MQPNNKPLKKRSLLAKILRGFGFFLLSLVILVVAILLLIQTKPVQNFGRKKIVGFLQNKLHTRVEIGGLDIDFPKKLVLENVYFEDKTKDTLLAGKQLKVDLDMFKLIKSEIQINEINLNGITAKIKRQLPDTTFNFQFIVDAFASKEKTPTEPKDTSAPLKMALDKIIIDKTRLVYDDVVTGNDVDVYLNHFDTRIKTFDLENLKYEVPRITINGLKGTISQTKPLAITAVTTQPTTAQNNTKPKFLKFINEEISLNDIGVNYSNDVSGLSTQIAFAALNVYPKDIDLEKTDITIDKIELQKLNGFLKMSAASSDVVKITNEKKEEVPMPWKLQVNSIKIDDNNFRFDDASKPRLPRGMDYGHMDIKDLTLHADNFKFDKDNIAADITEGTMKEKSGFILNKLKTNFTYTSKGATLEDLLIETPGTRLQRSAKVSYPSLEALQKNMGSMQLDVDIADSKVMVKDILIFAPALAAQPAFKNPNTTLYLDSRIRGSVSELHIDNFKAHGIGNTMIDVAGTIYGLPNAKNVTANLSIRNISTTRRDIFSFVPANTIPSTITIPEALALNGTLRGGMNKTFADLNLNTTLGSVKINGNIASPTDKKNATYDAAISTNALNLGAIMKNPQMGRLSASFNAKGRGFDPKVATAAIKGKILSADFNKYVYRNLSLNATIAKQQFTASANISDPNIDVSFVANGNIGGKYPSINVDATIDSIKTLPLHFTPNPIVYHGKINASFPQLNPDALTGKLFVTQSVLVANGQRIALDSLSVVANNTDGQQFLSVQSDFINATLDGQYKLTQLGTIIQSTIQPYFAIVPANTVLKTDPYNFNVNVTVIDHPTLRAFIPGLTRLDPITLVGNFSNVAGMKADLKVPVVIMGTNNINGLVLNANSEGNALKITTRLNGYTNGPSLALYNTSLDAILSNNQLAFTLATKDKAAKDKYRLGGTLLQENSTTYVFSLAPENLMLNYAAWSATPGNMIRYTGKDIFATNFNLSQGTQQLSINSTETGSNSPLQVSLNNFHIATLTAFVQTDSLLVDGMINGNVVLKNVLTLPSFTTDLTINNLALKRDTIGDVAVKVDNTTQNVFATDVRITGRGNDVSLTGNYYLKPANNSNLDFNLNIRQLPFKTIEAFSMGALNKTSGNLTGTVAINGSATAPKIDGGINFNNTAFDVVMLGSMFRIDNEAIKVNNEGIRFDTFTIKDSSNNTLTLDGIARTTNFTNYRFDMTLKARNFRALNAAKKPGSLYYGQLYFNSNLGIKGTETNPIVDGSLRINEKTSLFVVLPQSEPGVVDRKGVIEFVDMSNPAADSLFRSTVAKYDSSFNKTAVTGMDVTVNVEIVKEAVFNLIVDEGNGDFLKVQGEALLNAGIDPSGKTTLTGTYTLESGGYELSFNFIHRRFDIEKGSKITFNGDPTDALVDVTAIYVANTNSVDLVGQQVSQPVPAAYNQKLPFQVRLMVDGQLMQPVLTFGISLPTETSTLHAAPEVITSVNNRLEQLKAEPSELNKQVFALLLLNRFIGENPFQSGGSGGGFNAGLYAAQSVSKILSEQLNNLTTDLIAGVDINFDVNTSEDYRTGSAQQRTDFNVAVSKRLLNDRLKVTVGNNFELAGAQSSGGKGAGGIIGNLAVDYQLTQDGRYLIRAYRRNEDEGVVEGIVVETGLKFIVSVEYNKFKEIFEQRRGRKQVKKQEKQEKKEAKDSSKVETSTTLVQSHATDEVPSTQSNANTDTNKTPADDRKSIPAIDKALTDEY